MVETCDERELEQILKEKWTYSSRPNYITAQGFMLPASYLQAQKEIENFQVFDDDIWISSFPRTGTTWVSEMVWLIANNLDYEKGKSLPATSRVRFLALSFLISSEEKSHIDDKSFDNPINRAANQARPRFMKTHLPYQLLPKQVQENQKQPKVIYVCRNPMDTCVSYFHFSSSLKFTGNMDEFCKLFLSGKVVYGPFGEHVTSFWKIKDQPNVLFLRYEEMKENLSNVIQKTADFLGKSMSKDEITKLQQHLSFESMKRNPTVNGDKVLDTVRTSRMEFIRSGSVGGYKAEMSQAFIEAFQKRFREDLGVTGLKF